MKSSYPLFFLLFVTVMVTPMTLMSAHPAREVVEALHRTLIVVMEEGPKEGYEGRYNRLAPVIRESFDLPFIARTVVGRYWETLGNEQKTKFIETFSQLSIATYASNFDLYSGERFKVISEKNLDESHVMVYSRLVKSDGGEVQMDYILHRIQNRWRIINVIAEGVSDLALKRADYSAFLQKKSFDALMTKLNEKIAQYAR